MFGARGTGVGEGLEEWMRDGRESESQGEGGRDGMGFLGCNLLYSIRACGHIRKGE